MWTPSTLLSVGCALILAIGAAVMSRDRDDSKAPADTGPLHAIVFLMSILIMLVGLRMFGSGAGSSQGRFIDFADPLGIALAVVLVSYAMELTASEPRWGLLVSGGVVALAAIASGTPMLMAQHWRPSLEFFVGKQSYMTIHDRWWALKSGYELAAKVPAGQRAEAVNFLPGLTMLPASPYERPDGCEYLAEYSSVLFGSADEIAAIYKRHGVNYFLFDVSPHPPLVWTGFSRLFTPDTIKTRMRLVAHHQGEHHDQYLLTWNDDASRGLASGSDDGFLEKWTAKLAAQIGPGTFYPGFENGARMTNHADAIPGPRGLRYDGAGHH
jgi:hypothetical protein